MLPSRKRRRVHTGAVEVNVDSDGVNQKVDRGEQLLQYLLRMYCEHKPMTASALSSICYLAAEAGALGPVRKWGLEPSGWNLESGNLAKKVRREIRVLTADAGTSVEPIYIAVPGYNPTVKQRATLNLRVRAIHESLHKELFRSEGSFQDRGRHQPMRKGSGTGGREGKSEEQEE